MTPEVMIITWDRCELKATKVSFQDTVCELKPGETMTSDLPKKASKGNPN